jgi:hypothetical protein
VGGSCNGPADGRAVCDVDGMWDVVAIRLPSLLTSCVGFRYPSVEPWSSSGTVSMGRRYT